MTRISEILNKLFINLNISAVAPTEILKDSARIQVFDFDAGTPSDTVELTSETEISENESVSEASKNETYSVPSGIPSARLKVKPYTKIHYNSAYDVTGIKDSQNNLFGLIRFFESNSNDHNKPKTISKKHNGKVVTFKSYGVVDPWALDEDPPVNEKQAYDLMLKYLDKVAYQDIVNEFVPPADCSKTVTVYTVKKGDTLANIAAKYADRSVEDLKRANPGLTTNLTIGQKINIPAKGHPTKEEYYASLPQSVREALLDYNYRNGGPIWRSNSKKFKAALDKGLKTNNWNEFLSLLTSSVEKSSEGLSKRGFARVLLATRDLPKTKELKNHVERLYNEALKRAANYPQDIKDFYDVYKNGKITDKNSTLYNKPNSNTSQQKTTEQKDSKQTTQKTSSSQNKNIQTHTVKSGEVLSKIAQKYHTSVDEIMRLNGLKNDKIREGQILKVPSKASSKSNSGYTEYTVKSGDTLSKLAVKYHTTQKAIMDANGLKNEKINIGQKLKIPKSS